MRLALTFWASLAAASALATANIGDVCSLVFDHPLSHTDIGILFRSPQPIVIAELLKDYWKLCDPNTYKFEKKLTCPTWDAAVLPLSIPGCEMAVKVKQCDATISAAIDPKTMSVTTFNVSGDFDIELSSCTVKVAGGSATLPKGKAKASFHGSIPTGAAIADVMAGRVAPVVARALSASGQADVTHPLFNSGKALKLGFDLTHADNGLGPFKPRVEVDFPKSFKMPTFDFKNLSMAHVRVLQSVFDPSGAITSELLSKTPLGGAVERLLNGESLMAVIPDAQAKSLFAALEKVEPRMLADYNALGWRLQRKWNKRISASAEWKALGAHSLDPVLDRVKDALKGLVGEAVGEEARGKASELLRALLGNDVLSNGSFDCTFDGSIDVALGMPMERTYTAATNKVDFYMSLDPETVLKTTAVWGQGSVGVVCSASVGKSNFALTAGIDFRTDEPWQLQTLALSSRSLVQMMARRATRPYGAFALNLDIGAVSATINDLSLFDDKAPTVHVNADLAPAKAVVESIFQQVEAEAKILARKLPDGLAGLINVDTLTSVLGVSPRQAKVLLAVYEVIVKDQGVGLKNAKDILVAAGMPPEYEEYVQMVIDVLRNGASRSSILGADGVGETRDRLWGRGMEILESFLGGTKGVLPKEDNSSDLARPSRRHRTARVSAEGENGTIVDVMISRYVPQLPPFARRVINDVIAGKTPSIGGFLRFIEASCTNAPPKYAEILSKLCFGKDRVQAGLSGQTVLQKYGVTLNASFELSPVKIDTKGVGIQVQVRSRLSALMDYDARGAKEVAKDLCPDCAVPTVVMKPTDGSPLESIQQLIMQAYGSSAGGLQRVGVAVRGAQQLQGKPVSLATFSEAEFSIDSHLEVFAEFEATATINVEYTIGGTSPLTVKLASFEPFVSATGSAKLLVNANVSAAGNAMAAVGTKPSGAASGSLTFASGLQVVGLATFDIALDSIKVAGSLFAEATVNAQLAASHPLFGVSGVITLQDSDLSNGLQFGDPRYAVKMTKADLSGLIDLLIAKVEKLLGDVNVDETKNSTAKKPSPLIEAAGEVMNAIGLDLFRPGQTRGFVEILKIAKERVMAAPIGERVQDMIDGFMAELLKKLKEDGATALKADTVIDIIQNTDLSKWRKPAGREAEVSQVSVGAIDLTAMMNSPDGPLNYLLSKATAKFNTDIHACWDEQIPFSHVTFLKDAFDKLNNIPFVSAQLNSAEEAYVPGMAIQGCWSLKAHYGFENGAPYAGIKYVNVYAKPRARMPSFAINLPMIAGASIRNGHMQGDVSFTYTNADPKGEIATEHAGGQLAPWQLKAKIEVGLPVFASIMGEEVIAGEQIHVLLDDPWKNPRPTVTLPDVDRFIAAVKLTPSNALLLLRSLLSAPQDLIGPGSPSDAPIPMIAATIGEVFNLQEQMDAILPYLERPMVVEENYFDTFAPAVCEGSITSKAMSLKLKVVWNRDPVNMVPVKRAIEDAIQVIPNAEKLVGDLVGEGAPPLKLPNALEVTIPIPSFSRTTILTTILPVLAKYGLTASIIDNVPCDTAVGNKPGCSCWQLRMRPDLSFLASLWDFELSAEVVEADKASPTGEIGVTLDGRPLSMLGSFAALDTIPAFDSWEEVISLVANLALGDCRNPIQCVASAINGADSGKISKGPITCAWNVEFGQPGLLETVRDFYPVGMVLGANCSFAAQFSKGAATKLNLNLLNDKISVKTSGAAQLVAEANATIRAKAVFPSLPMNDELKLVTHLSDHGLTQATAKVEAGKQKVTFCAEWDTRHVLANGKKSAIHHDECHTVELPVGPLFPDALNKLPTLLPQPIGGMLTVSAASTDANSALANEVVIALNQQLVDAKSSAAFVSHIGTDFTPPLRGLISPVRFEIRDSQVLGLLGVPATATSSAPPEVVEFGAYRLVLEDTSLYAAVSAEVTGGRADVNFNNMIAANTDDEAFSAYGHAIIELRQKLPLTPMELGASFVRTDLLRRNWQVDIGASIAARAGPLKISAMNMDIAATPAVGLKTGMKVDKKHGRPVIYHAPYQVGPSGAATRIRGAYVAQDEVVKPDFPTDPAAVAEVLMTKVWDLVESGEIKLPEDAWLRPADALASVMKQILGVDITILGGKEFKDFIDLLSTRPKDMSICDAVGSFTKIASVATQLPMADRKLPLVDLSVADVWDRIDPYVSAVDSICDADASIEHLGMIESLIDQRLSKLSNESGVTIDKAGSLIRLDFTLTTPTLPVKAASRWDLASLLSGGKLSAADTAFLAKLDPGVGVAGEITIQAKMMIKTVVAIDLTDWSISILSQSGVATSLYLKAYADLSMTIGEPLSLRGNVGIRSGTGEESAAQLGLYTAKDWKIVAGSTDVPALVLSGHGSAGVKGAVTYGGTTCEVQFTVGDLPGVIRGSGNSIVVVNEFSPAAGQTKCDLIAMTKNVLAKFALGTLVKKSRQVTNMIFVPLFQMRDKLMTRAPGSLPLVGTKAHEAVINFFDELKEVSDDFHDNLAKAVAAAPGFEAKPTTYIADTMMQALCDALEGHRMVQPAACTNRTAEVGTKYVLPIKVDRTWDVPLANMDFNLGGPEATGELRLDNCKADLNVNIRLQFTVILDPSDGIRLALSTFNGGPWFEGSARAIISDGCELKGRLGVMGATISTSTDLCPNFEEKFYKYVEDPAVTADKLRAARRNGVLASVNDSGVLVEEVFDVFNMDHVHAAQVARTSSFNPTHIRAARTAQFNTGLASQGARGFGASTSSPAYQPVASGPIPPELAPTYVRPQKMYPKTSLQNGIEIRYQVHSPPNSPLLDAEKGVRPTEIGAARGFSLVVGVKALLRARVTAGLVGLAKDGLDAEAGQAAEGKWKGGMPKFQSLINVGWAFAADTGRKLQTMPPAFSICDSAVCLGSLVDDVLRGPIAKMQKVIEPLEPLLGKQGLRKEVTFPSKMTLLDLLLRIQTSACKSNTCGWEGVEEWILMAMDLYDLSKTLESIADRSTTGDGKCANPVRFSGESCSNCDVSPLVTARGERVVHRTAVVLQAAGPLLTDKPLADYTSSAPEKKFLQTIQKHVYSAQREFKKGYANVKGPGLKLSLLDNPLQILTDLIIPSGAGDFLKANNIVELVFPEFLISFRVSWLVPLPFPLTCLAPRVNLHGSLRIDVGSVSLTHVGFMRAWNHVRSQPNSGGIVAKSTLVLSNVLSGVGISSKVSPTQDRALLSFGLEVGASKSLDFVTIVNDCLGSIISIPKWVMKIVEKARSFLPVDVDFQADFKLALTFRGSFFLPDPNNDGIATMAELWWMVKYNGVRFMTLKMQLYFEAAGSFKLAVRSWLFSDFEVASVGFSESWTIWSENILPSCWPPQLAYEDQVNLKDMGSQCFARPPIGQTVPPKARPTELSVDGSGKTDDDSNVDVNAKPWWESDDLAPTLSAGGQQNGGALTVPSDRPSNTARDDALAQASFKAPPKTGATTTTRRRAANVAQADGTTTDSQASTFKAQPAMVGDSTVDLVVNNVRGTVAAPLHKFNNVRWPTANLPGTSGTVAEHGATGFGSGGFDIQPAACDLLNMAAAKAGHVTDVLGTPCDTLLTTDRLIVGGTADKYHGKLLSAPPKIEESVHPVGKESVKTLNFVEDGLPFRNKLGLSIRSADDEVARVGIDMIEEISLIGSTTNPTKFLIDDKDDSYTLRITGAGQDGHVYLGPHVHGPVSIIGGTGYNALVHDYRQSPKPRHPVFEAREAAELAARAEQDGVGGTRRRRAAAAAIATSEEFAISALFGNFTNTDMTAIADADVSKAHVTSFIASVIAETGHRLQQHARSSLSPEVVLAAARTASARGRSALVAETVVADHSAGVARIRAAVAAGNRNLDSRSYFLGAADADDGALSYTEALLHARFNEDPAARVAAETYLSQFPRGSRPRTLLAKKTQAGRARSGQVLADTPGNDIIIGSDYLTASGGGRDTSVTVDQVASRTIYLNEAPNSVNRVTVVGTQSQEVISTKGTAGQDQKFIRGCTSSTMTIDVGANNDTVEIGAGSMAGGALSCLVIADLGADYDTLIINASLETRELHLVAPLSDMIVLRSFEPSGEKNELTVRFRNVEEFTLIVGSGRLVMDMQHIPVFGGVFKVTSAPLAGAPLAEPNAPHTINVNTLAAGQVLDVDLSKTGRAVAVTLGVAGENATFTDVAGFVRVTGDSSLTHGTSVRLVGAENGRAAENVVIASKNGATCVRPLDADAVKRVTSATAAGAAQAPAALVKGACASAEDPEAVKAAGRTVADALATVFGADTACGGVNVDGALEAGKTLHGLMVVGHIAAVDVRAGSADNVIGAFLGEATETSVFIEGQTGNDVLVAECGTGTRCRVLGGGGVNSVAVIAAGGAVEVDTTSTSMSPSAKGSVGVVAADGPVVDVTAVAPAGAAHAGIGTLAQVNGGVVLNLVASVGATAGMDVGVCARASTSVTARGGAVGEQFVHARVAYAPSGTATPVTLTLGGGSGADSVDAIVSGYSVVLQTGAGDDTVTLRGMAADAVVNATAELGDGANVLHMVFEGTAVAVTAGDGVDLVDLKVTGGARTTVSTAGGADAVVVDATGGAVFVGSGEGDDAVVVGSHGGAKVAIDAAGGHDIVIAGPLSSTARIETDSGDDIIGLAPACTACAEGVDNAFVSGGAGSNVIVFARIGESADNALLASNVAIPSAILEHARRVRVVHGDGSAAPSPYTRFAVASDGLTTTLANADGTIAFRGAVASSVSSRVYTPAADVVEIGLPAVGCPANIENRAVAETAPVSSFELPPSIQTAQHCFKSAPGPMTVLGRNNAMVIGEPSLMNIQWPASAAPSCVRLQAATPAMSPAGFHTASIGVRGALPNANLTVSLDDMLVTTPCLNVETADGNDKVTIVLGASWAKFDGVLSKVKIIGHGGTDTPNIHDYRGGASTNSSGVPAGVGPVDGSAAGGAHANGRMPGEAVYSEVSVGSTSLRVTFPAAEGPGAKPVVTSWDVSRTANLTLDRFESVRLVGGLQAEVVSLSLRTTVVLTRAEKASASLTYDALGRLVLLRNVSGERKLITLPAAFESFDMDFGGSDVDITIAEPPAFISGTGPVADATAVVAAAAGGVTKAGPRSGCPTKPRGEVVLRGLSAASTVRGVASMTRFLPAKGAPANSGHASYTSPVPSVRYSVVSAVAKVVVDVTLATNGTADAALSRSYVSAAVDVDATMVRWGAFHAALLPTRGAAVEMTVRSLAVPLAAEGVDPLAVSSPIAGLQPAMRHPVIIRNAGSHAITLHHVGDSAVRTLPVAITPSAAHPLVDASPISYDSAIAAVLPTAHAKVSVTDACGKLELSQPMLAVLAVANGAKPAEDKTEDEAKEEGEHRQAVTHATADVPSAVITLSGPIHVVAHTLSATAEVTNAALKSSGLTVSWEAAAFVRADVVVQGAAGSAAPTLTVSSCPNGGVSVSAASDLVKVDATAAVGDHCRVPPVIYNTPHRRISVDGPQGHPVVYGYTAATPRAQRPATPKVDCIASRYCPSGSSDDRCVYLSLGNTEFRTASYEADVAASGRSTNATDKPAQSIDASVEAAEQSADAWPRVRGWSDLGGATQFSYDATLCVVPSITCSPASARAITFRGPASCSLHGVPQECREQVRPGVIIADASTAQCIADAAGKWSVTVASESVFSEIHGLNGLLTSDGSDTTVAKASYFMIIFIVTIVIATFAMAVTRLPLYLGAEAFLIIGFAASQDSSSYALQLGTLMRTLERVMTITFSSDSATVSNTPSSVAVVIFAVVAVIVLAAIIAIAAAAVAASARASGRSTRAKTAAPLPSAASRTSDIADAADVPAGTSGSVIEIGGTPLYRVYAAVRVVVYALVVLAPWALWASARLARTGGAGAAALGMLGVFAVLAALAITCVEYTISDPQTLKVLTVFRRGVVIGHWAAVLIILLVGAVIGGASESVTTLGWVGIVYAIIQTAFVGYYFAMLVSRLGRAGPATLRGANPSKTAELHHKWVRTCRWLTAIVLVALVTSVIGAVVSVMIYMGFQTGVSSGVEDIAAVLYWVWVGLGVVSLAVLLGYAFDSCRLPHAGGVPMQTGWVDIVSPPLRRGSSGSEDSDDDSDSDDSSEMSTPRGKAAPPMPPSSSSDDESVEAGDDDLPTTVPAVAHSPTSPVASSPSALDARRAALQMQSFAPNGAAAIHPSFAGNGALTGMSFAPNRNGATAIHPSFSPNAPLGAEPSFVQGGGAMVHPLASSASEAFQSAALRQAMREKKRRG